MRFISFTVEKEERFGVLYEEESIVVDLYSYFRDKGVDLPTLLSFIQTENINIEEVRGVSESYQLSMENVYLQAPIPKPLKNIFCVGKNYRDHAIEMGSEKDIPEHPMIFTKAPTSVSAPEDVLSFSKGVSEALDYEGELAVVIGKKGKSISREHAMDYVFGYTILNDITARDLQKKHGQFFVGKSLDHSCPIGPAILHASNVRNPHDFDLITLVNGEVRQDGHTSDLIFDIPELIHVLSKGMTLEAGDIIATGTPSGVGKGYNPPKYLADRDRVEIRIEGIGALRNEISIR
ncbi:fumarylacetoacetate hydrolase family protein [Alkalihalobacillus macyae]|uniref:fumarylacetoacetate hydrolase family protein n=1 Tax=Guptibacillus hwajinpoensis TaxID=208199 RepID=UPI00273AB03C|nr:fumarylacetoacetate hydrolase family protein [Alkalihalobacillus macyae]MDP4550727.1 fumarylacetoacetate hydrolase family protein [Alkalihalobacillus macyae]